MVVAGLNRSPRPCGRSAGAIRQKDGHGGATTTTKIARKWVRAMSKLLRRHPCPTLRPFWYITCQSAELSTIETVVGDNPISFVNSQIVTMGFAQSKDTFCWKTQNDYTRRQLVTLDYQ